VSGRIFGSTVRMPGRLVLRSCLVACVLTSSLGAAAADPPQAVHDSQWALQTVDTEKTWEISKGDGVTVAVIDTGVDASHPDLRGQVARGADFGDGASGDGTHDPGGRGHGTQVASLIAGTAQNYDGAGLYGLAPEAEILPFGAYRDGEPHAAAVSRAIRAAVDRGAQVIVAPAVATEADSDLQSATRHAIDRDVLVVSGVGDDPTATIQAAATLTANTQTYPAALPGVVAVTAIDRDGQLLAQAERGSHVVIAAPGVEILAAASGGSYWTGDDTAFAAAWVAGTAALVRSAHPDWTAGQVIQKLIDTARRPEGSGRSDDYGYGVVDPFRALSDEAVPSARTNPLLAPDAPPGAGPAITTDAQSDDAVGQLALLLGAVLVGMVLFVVVFARILSKTAAFPERRVTSGPGKSR
jgi:type VII secretion-associated serine protease mycosin